MKRQFYYKRFIWIIFIILYSGLFFYNCLSPYHNWFFSYIYTMILIIWLCREYYQKKLFFQPSFFPVEAHNYILRGLFALFFYSSFVLGITTIVWWQKFRIFNNFLLPVVGICLLGYGIYLREQIPKLERIQATTRFYLSILLIIFSMALGYDSYFLIIYTIVIGLPLVLLQIGHYKKAIRAIDY